MHHRNNFGGAFSLPLFASQTFTPMHLYTYAPLGYGVTGVQVRTPYPFAFGDARTPSPEEIEDKITPYPFEVKGYRGTGA